MNDRIPRAVDLGGLCDVVVSLELHTGSCEFIFMLVKTKKHMKRNRPNKQRQVRMATFAESRMRMWMANEDGVRMLRHISWLHSPVVASSNAA